MSCPFIFLMMMMMITIHPHSFFKIYHQQDYMTGSTNGSKPTKRNKIRNELNFCWCGSGTISENIQNSQNWIKQKIENEQKQEWREILLLEQRHWHNIPELQVGSNPDSAKLGFYKILQQGQPFASSGGWAHVNQLVFTTICSNRNLIESKKNNTTSSRWKGCKTKTCEKAKLNSQ